MHLHPTCSFDINENTVLKCYLIDIVINLKKRKHFSFK